MKKPNFTRRLALALALLLSLMLLSCDKPNETPPAAFHSGVVAAWYDPSSPDENAGNITGGWDFRVGNGAFAAIHAMFPAEIETLHSARLWVRISEGDGPASPSIAAISENWSISDTTYTEMAAMLDTAASTAFKLEADGWVSFDITDAAKKWISAEMPNYGFALSDTATARTAYDSANSDDESVHPKLELSYAAYDDAKTTPISKFPFTMVGDYEGNCLAYALRDKDMILSNDLGVDFGEMNSLYSAGGGDAVAEYIAKLTESYVAAHAESLAVSGFRRIDSYDSAIDTAAEYRAVLRFGYPYPDMPMDDRNFDFHWRVQSNSGRWVQKFPLEAPGHIPCLPAFADPAKFMWDSAWVWGNYRFQDVYTSKPIYFAVTKGTPDFTMHLDGAGIPL
jgi:hypothetical protein